MEHRLPHLKHIIYQCWFKTTIDFTDACTCVSHTYTHIYICMYILCIYIYIDLWFIYFCYLSGAPTGCIWVTNSLVCFKMPLQFRCDSLPGQGLQSLLAWTMAGGAGDRYRGDQVVSFLQAWLCWMLCRYLQIVCFVCFFGDTLRCHQTCGLEKGPVDQLLVIFLDRNLHAVRGFSIAMFDYQMVFLQMPMLYTHHIYIYVVWCACVMYDEFNDGIAWFMEQIAHLSLLVSLRGRR